MRISVQFQRKVRGQEEFTSNSFHVGIESEPPAEVAQDRSKLKAYVEELFRECRARVDDQVGQASPKAAPAPRAEERTPRAAPTGRRPPPARASRAAPSTNGNGESGLATAKQLNFLRSLGQQGGLSYGQLSALAEETFGTRDLRDLSKKQASELIDQLRTEAA